MIVIVCLIFIVYVFYIGFYVVFVENNVEVKLGDYFMDKIFRRM